MPRVLRRQLLAEEDVAEVSTAVVTDDFRAVAIDVSQAIHCAGNLIIEAGPTAMAVEFAVGEIQRCLALTADERARVFQIGVFADEGPFGPFVQDDVGFGSGQFIHVAARRNCWRGVICADGGQAQNENVAIAQNGRSDPMLQ